MFKQLSIVCVYKINAKEKNNLIKKFDLLLFLFLKINYN